MAVSKQHAGGFAVNCIREELMAPVQHGRVDQEEATDLLNTAFGGDPRTADAAIQANAELVPSLPPEVLRGLRDDHMRGAYELARGVREALIRGNLDTGALTVAGLEAKHWAFTRHLIGLALEMLMCEELITVSADGSAWEPRPMGREGETARRMLEWADGYGVAAPHVRLGVGLLAGDVVSSVFAVGDEWRRCLRRSVQERVWVGGPTIVGALCAWIDEHMPVEQRERWAAILEILRDQR